MKLNLLKLPSHIFQYRTKKSNGRRDNIIETMAVLASFSYFTYTTQGKCELIVTAL